jgi:2-polyprenyl-3-methyl-5-hydroxy-6-metoxy-1,4-benzoquinol methylase
MGRLTAAFAERLMRLVPRQPPDPRQTVGGLGEVFQHPAFTSGSSAERQRIMRADSEFRYEDENAFPWDNYFGRSVKQWVTGDVLDLGCSSGGRAVAWWERYEPRSMSGVDISETLVEAARMFAESRGVHGDFRVGSGESIPWPDRSFEAILTFDVLEHVQSVSKTLEECWRVLRPGGHLLAVFPSYFQPVEHHLGLVTGVPGLQYMFTGKTLLRAYINILDERGPDASWYGRDRTLAPWERGNTINGTTARRFAQLIRSQGWDVVLQSRLPIGGVGRRAQAGKGRFLAAVSRPLTRVPLLRDVALHRITYVLRKPGGRVAPS